jgi:hypothetical protein
MPSQTLGQPLRKARHVVGQESTPDVAGGKEEEAMGF